LRGKEKPTVTQTFIASDIDLPVSGSVSKLPGEPFPGGNASWAGIIIDSEPNSSVRSVGAGEIVFASDFNALSNLVILDHGDNYLTLYGNLRSLTVTPGMLIPKGTMIGRTHGRNSNQGDGLYFEIRKNGIPIDPKIWFKY
jgi:Membrane-bound metallopeptidase